MSSLDYDQAKEYVPTTGSTLIDLCADSDDDDDLMQSLAMCGQPEPSAPPGVNIAPPGTARDLAQEMRLKRVARFALSN
jgi:hypothetical protein